MSGKNKNAVSAEKAIPQVENVDVTSTSAETTPSVEITEGLEDLEAASKPKIDYSNIDFLSKNPAVITEEFASSKFDPEREVKVQNGLNEIQLLLGEKIDPLVYLLAKWWEIKPARAAIKKMIDEKAKANNIPVDIFMGVNLRENVDKLGGISQAVDRMKYSLTYYKPRPGKESKDVFKQMLIDDVLYNVSLTALNNAKALFPDDREAIKAEVLKTATKAIVEEI